MAEVILVSEEVEEMNYLEYKTEILFEFGLTNKEKVQSYLEEKCANATTEIKKRIQIDNAARKIMDEFFDGSREFVDGVELAEYYLRIIKRNYPNVEALYEDVIHKLVGTNGLNALKEANLIEVCGGYCGRKLYAI